MIPTRLIVLPLCGLWLMLSLIVGSDPPLAWAYGVGGLEPESGGRQSQRSGIVAYQGAEGEWADVFGKPGVNGPVYALGSYQDMLLVGGGFDRAGQVDARYAAGWSESGWTAIGDPEWGTGPDGARMIVHAFEVYGSALVAGGRITGTSIDDVIAVWDGGSWTGLGDLGDPGVCTVKDLTVYGDCLVAGGLIPPKRYVASYDGSEWNTLGEGTNGEVLALTVYRGELIAGGRFTKADEKPVRHIAGWNGLAWEEMGEGLEGNVHALTVLGGHLVAGGDFDGFMAVWNDTCWTTAPPGIPGPVLCLGLSPGADSDSAVLGAGGDATSGFLVSCLDLSALDLEVVSTGFDGGIYAIGADACSGDSAVYVGGAFGQIDTVGANNIAMLDHGSFAYLGAQGYGLDLDVEALGVYGDRLIAATVSGPIVAWDGLAWEALAGEVDGHINVIMSHGGDLFVGGDFDHIDGQALLNVAAWDGALWSPLGGGVNGEIYDLTIFDGNLIGVGSFSGAGAVAADNMAMWDGSSWSEVGNGRAHPVDQVTMWDGKLVVSVRNVIQTWDGAFWRLLGSTSGTVRCLEPFGRSLIAAGDFYEIGGLDARRIAVWDGESWSPMGEGLAGNTGWPDYWGGVLDVAVYNGNPVAVGYFDSPCLNVARWDGFAWRCLGGLDSVGNALAVWDGHLAAGGAFETAGTLSSYRIAVWDDFVDPVDSLDARGRDEAILVSWRNPNDSAYQGTLIRYSLEGYPQGPAEGFPVPNGNGGRFDAVPGSDSSFYHADLGSDMTYYYSGFTYDAQDRFSSGTLVSATTLDKNPPDTVTDFTATPEADLLRLGWTNPSTEDFRGTLIRYSASGYPADPDSGEPVPNGSEGRFEAQPGSQGSFLHAGLQEAGTYYYSAFSYDHDMNHAPGVHSSGFVPDISPPELAIRVFQNPYLTRYLDVYLVCSEPCDSASVSLKVGSDSLTVSPVDGRPDLWVGNHRLSGPGGTVHVLGSAADTTGNSNSASKSFEAALLTCREGGVVRSVDRRLSLDLPPGALRTDTYVTVVSCDGSAGLSDFTKADSRAGSESGGKSDPGWKPGDGQAYRCGPYGALEGPGGRLAITYGDSGRDGGISPDRICIELVGFGRLGSFVEPETRVVTAEVSHLGAFRTVIGEPGSAKILEPAYLRLAPCRPNPFTVETAITFEIRAPQQVRIAVYDVMGRLVEEVANGPRGPGIQRLSWTIEGAAHRDLPGGIYFLRATTAHSRATAKLILLR